MLIRIVAVVAILTGVLAGESKHEYVTDDELLSPLQGDDGLYYHDLIVRGRIASVDYTTIGTGEWVATEESAAEPMDIALIGIDVFEFLKGDSTGARIYVATLPAGVHYNISDEMILCCIYNKEYAGYIIRGPTARFYPHKEGEWLREVNGRMYTIEQIRQVIRATSLTTVTKDADFIIRGVVKETQTRRFANDHMDVRLADYDFGVKAVYKGAITDSVITFSLITRGPIIPDWYREPAYLPETGDQWIVFLKREAFGYYPFAGRNGMIRIDGERPMKGGLSPYKMKVNVLTGAIQHNVAE